MGIKRYLVICAIILLFTSCVVCSENSTEMLIEQMVLPIAQRSNSNYFSANEISEILKLAEQNGLCLLPEFQELLDMKVFFDAEYTKEGTIWMLLASTYGDKILQWPVDIQKWYYDILSELELKNAVNLTVPESNEISEEQAIDIAKEYIYRVFQERFRLDDTRFYEIGKQYVEDKLKGENEIRYWKVYFNPLILEAGTYELEINHNGEVLNVLCRPGFEKGESFEDMYNMILSVYGLDIGLWPQQAYQELKKASELMGNVTSAHMNLISVLQKTEYPDLSGDYLGKEDAYFIAAERLGFSSYSRGGAVFIEDTPNPVWKVNIDDLFYFEIDSVTREIKEDYERVGIYDEWASRVALKKTVDRIHSK